MNKILLFIYFFSFTLTANSQAVDFSYQSTNGLFCNPSTIQFTQSSSGSPVGFVWNFGNGATSNSPNPAITYASAGVYLVKLIAIYPQNAVEVTKIIVINPSITASVGYDRNYICKPGIIHFTSASSGSMPAYNWDFGDGSGLVTTAADTISHNYLNFGVYNVTLKATDVTGCFATTNATVTVQPLPHINGTVSATSGCVPAVISFGANPVIPVNSTAIYSWDFKDGSPISSTTTNFTNHVYNAAGGYFPTITITTSEGCSRSDTISAVAFGTPPVNLVAYPFNSTICGSDPAVFYSKAVNANSYFWDFGDGRTAATSDTIIQHKYRTLGVKNINVTPAYNGCKGNQLSFPVTVKGVIASYDYVNTCGDKKTFSFSNQSQGNLSTVSWDFGDGSPVLNTINASHTFQASGSFAVTLRVTDNTTGCADVYSELIHTANPSLVNTDSSVCKSTGTTFSLINNYGNPSATYTWNVAGLQLGPFSAPSITVNPPLLGFYNNYVVINNGTQYCSDTISLSRTILVKGPVISFTAPDTICINGLYSVTNTSMPFIPTDSIKSWSWNFGVTGAIDNAYQPLPFTFNGLGVYKVKLIGIDKNGCKDSLEKTVTTNTIPFLRVIPGIDTLCLGKSDTLIAFHNDNISWSPANLLSCTGCDSAITSPSTTTTFYITATNGSGCAATDSILVKVFKPFVAVPFLTDPYICLNDSVKLILDPPMKRIIWSPSTGLSDPNNYGPVATPLKTTRYTATLTDSAGCFTSSADFIVHVKSLPVVDAGPDKIYPYYTNYTFTPLYSSNVSTYTWAPSALLSCNSCAVPKGVAAYSTKYFIKVISDSGCIAKDSVTIFVECKDANIVMPTAFSPNNDNINDYYFPLTRGIKSILRFSVYNRSGALVYEARNFPPNNKAFGWNGKINKADQSSTVFVYYLEVLCDVGEKLYSKGSFILLR